MLAVRVQVLGRNITIARPHRYGRSPAKYMDISAAGAHSVPLVFASTSGTIHRCGSQVHVEADIHAPLSSSQPSTSSTSNITSMSRRWQVGIVVVIPFSSLFHLM